MDNDSRGLMPGWVRNLFARPKTPQWYTVPVEKGVLVSGSEDEAALASLQGHPGVQALLNRLKLQSAVLERQLVTVHHKDLHDVYFLQSGITWVRYEWSYRLDFS